VFCSQCINALRIVYVININYFLNNISWVFCMKEMKCVLCDVVNLVILRVVTLFSVPKSSDHDIWVSSSLETWVNALAARIFLSKFQGHFHTTLLNSSCKSRFTNNFESLSMKICVESWIQERQLGEACISLAVKVQHVKKQKTSYW